MKQNYLDGYVDVPTRLRLALDAFPDLRIQETGREIVETGDRTFLVCTVTVWRTPDDPIPVTGSAWEPLPGLTAFTKNSELMVGMTSALGRCLGYLGLGIDKAIASQNEVDARNTGETPRTSSDAPKRESLGSAATGPTDAQKRLLNALGHKGPIPKTKADASSLIDTLKAAQTALDDARNEPDPF